MSALCPSRGAVELITRDGEIYWLPTICKTWKCLACQPKLMALIQARIRYGMVTLGPCLFITVTYVMRRESDLRDASSVHADLKSLWRTLGKTTRWKNVSYVRVPELTKKGQVHVHMIVGNVKGTATCRRGTKEPLKTWKGRECNDLETCIQHQLSRVWDEITGGSFVVDVSKVRSGSRTASYITGYIRKDFIGHQELEARGFRRRYAFSRNWPSLGHMELANTRDGEWRKVNRVPIRYLNHAYPEISDYILKGGDSGILESVGENVVTHIFGDPEINRLKRAVKHVRRMPDGKTAIQNNHQAPAGTNHDR